MLTVLIFSSRVFPQSTRIENPSYGGSSRYQVTPVPTGEPEIPADSPDVSDSPVEDNSETDTARTVVSSVFNSEDITAARAVSLPDFLLTKGFLVMTSGGAGSKSNLSYKGYAGFCVKVYIDGISANNLDTGEFDWNSVNLDTVESIEIDETPALTDFDFACCIVRITTKRGNHITVNSGVLSYESNPFDTEFLNFSMSNGGKKGGFRLGAFLLAAENEYKNPEGRTHLYNGSHQSNVSAGWNVFLFDSLNLSGTHSFYYNKLKCTNTGSDLNAGIEKDLSAVNSVSLLWSGANFTSKTDIQVNYSDCLYYSDVRARTFDSLPVVRCSLNEYFSWLLDFLFAVEFDCLAESPARNRIAVNTGVAKSFSFGELSMEFQLKTPFLYNKSFGFTIVPCAEMSYKGFYAVAFREYILPTFNQLYYPETSQSAGNPNLKPESGWSFKAGFHRGDVPVYADYKFSYYGNKIRWTSDGGQLKPENISDGIFNVITLGFQQKWFGCLDTSAEVIWTSAKLKDTWKQIMWVPEWSAHVNATFSLGMFQVSADYSYTGKRPASNDNILFYEPLHLLNASVSISPKPWLTIYFRAANILNQRVYWHDSYSNPSRGYTLGATVAF